MSKKVQIKAGIFGVLIASAMLAHAEDYTYTINSGSITITGYTGAGGDVTIPETINGLPVTEIGYDAFYQNSNITSLTVPDSVLRIDEWAFSWTSMSSVTLGNGVTNIGGSAFSECSSLTNVTFGANVEHLGAQLFFFTFSLEGVYFYGDAPALGDEDVFFGCTNATAYYINGKTGWGPTLGGIPTALWGAPVTSDYLLDVSIVGNGTLSHSDGLYSEGSPQTVVATPDAGWLFMGWSGDASGTNDAVLIMDGPKAVTATFSDDADGDGLTNTEEAGYGSNPWKKDTDDDGFDDAFEVAQGMSPTINNSAITDYIGNHGSTFGLYPSNVVLDVAVGQMVIETSGGAATLSLQIEESGDLVNWTNAGPAEVWTRPVDGEKKYFRVRSSK